MNETLKSWLDELKDEKLACNPAGIRCETKNNYWSFSFPKNENIGIDDAVEFFETIAAIKADQVVGNMIYYVWFDDMSHQLCYCIASASKDNLPFGCTVVHAEKLSEVVSQYFNSENEDYVPNEDLKEISMEEAFSEDEEDIEYKLKVWSKELGSAFRS